MSDSGTVSDGVISVRPSQYQTVREPESVRKPDSVRKSEVSLTTDFKQVSPECQRVSAGVRRCRQLCHLVSAGVSDRHSIRSFCGISRHVSSARHYKRRPSECHGESRTLEAPIQELRTYEYTQKSRKL